MAKVIMLQGTMSNVGKSFLTAGLCRIFMQDGYSAVPFKSQNMALNSYITEDGSEIGRAQAMQAESAGLKPSVLMNPILLKPTTDVGSQVIVNGRVMGNMTASEYFRYRKNLIPEIMTAYQKLASQHDIIVIEGAGSPAELNLNRDDIVNMGLAKLVKSPVLLIGDIDRGGIFAQLLGTLNLLEAEEQAFVKGMIVNQFRGDKALFSDGVRILEEKSGLPVLGVVPYTNIDIEEEDSLSHKLNQESAPNLIDIAVIHLPRISNFTDFDVFSQYKGVSVRYVRKSTELGIPDLIILPGTKSTISDMRWMRESGIETAIKKCVSEGVPLFGICGGYQMLGEAVSDPESLENGGTIAGMSLLSGKTVFTGEKQQIQVSGNFSQISGFWNFLSGAEFSGYEIHLGRTSQPESALTSCGGAYAGTVAGCYVHGIFDSADVSGRIIKELYLRKGVVYHGQVTDRRIYKQQQFNLLADTIRRSLDMNQIYRILQEGL